MVDVQNILTRYAKVKADHDGNWMTLWREARDYVQPSNVDYMNEGSRRGSNIYDPTAIDANLRMAAGIFSWMCPSDKRWFELQPMYEEMKKIDAVKWWFVEANRILFEALNSSNWPLMFHESVLNLGSVGTGVLYIEEGDRTLLNFLSLNIEKVCILEDKEQRVDTEFREFEFTARQCVQEFGFDKCTEEIKTAYQSDGLKEKKFNILHVVMPRQDSKAKFGRIESTEMPYASCCIDIKTKTCLKESGFHENPFVVFRFLKNNDEPYGRGSGMNYIQEIKMLNRYRKSDILGLEKIVDPPILSPDDCLTSKTFMTGPGGVTYYKPMGDGRIKPEPFFDGANLPQLKDGIQESRQMIRNGFHNDIFDALGEKYGMTIPEVMERVGAKLVPFAPVVGRLQCELFGPMLTRSFGILLRAGALPPLPDELMMNPQYKIEYVSRISLAIKQLESKGLMDSIAVLEPFIKLKPEILDNYNFDEIARGVNKNNGVPAEWINSLETVQMIRMNRAEDMKQQQMAMELNESAKSIPALGKAPERGSPLKMLMGGQAA